MTTPMYEMEKFLEYVRDEASTILREHREWFRDDSAEVACPEAHYEEVDNRILRLAVVLARKAERIQIGRAKLVKEREQELKAEAEDHARDVEDEGFLGAYDDDPSPYEGTYSEE